MSAVQEMARMLDDALPTSGVPGVAVGMWADGEEHYLVRGVTSVAAPIAIDEDTLFQTGSTTKTYVALAVLRLVEAGKLKLDVPVRAYVPELQMADPLATELLTLRHLLTHTGGHDGDLLDDFGGGADCLSRLAAGMHVLPQLAPLGTWTYSNAGFSVVGRAIETATGLTFEQAVRALVLDPLGHTNSVFGANEAITRRVAIGHRPTASGPQVTQPWAIPRPAWPAGGLVSSARDQIGYARFHLGDGRAPDGSRIVSSDNLAYMRMPLAEAGGGRAAAVGLAWLLQPTPGVIAHGGSANGQESAFVIVPDKEFAITVLTNSTSGALLHGPIVKWALRHVARTQPYKPPTEPGDPSLLPQYAGRFVSQLEELVVTHELDGLALTMNPTARALDLFPEMASTDAMRFEVFADDRVVVRAGALQGARGEFVRNRAGKVSFLRMLGRIHRLQLP